MKVWRMNHDNVNYSGLLSSIDLKYKDYMKLTNGKYKKWRKLKIEREQSNLPLSDLPWSELNILILSKKAADVLTPMIGEHIKLHRLNFEEEYYALYVKTRLDAINYEKSKFVRFESSGRIMRFLEYSFHLEKIKGVPIFNVIDENTSNRAFVSDEVKEIVEKNHLTGFIFTLAWDSESTD